jgi:hypothetical protein
MFFVNEGGVDLSKTAATASEYGETSKTGDLIYTVGALTSDTDLGDGYIISEKRAAFISVAYMYSWVEHESSKTTENVGGSTDTTYTYAYSKEWTTLPDSSDGFQESNGHENPQDRIALTKSLYVTRYADAYINGLSISEGDVGKLGLPENVLELNAQTVKPEHTDLIKNDYIYLDYDDESQESGAGAKIGDIRIAYYEVKSGIDGMVIGRLDGSYIRTYRAERKTAFTVRHGELLRWFGTSDLNEATSALATEYRVMLWIFRVVGTIMIYVGFLLLLNPLTTILSFVPFLGRMSGGLIALVFLPVSVVISAVAILLAVFLNNLITFIILVGALVALAIAGIVKRSKKTSAARRRS